MQNVLHLTPGARKYYEPLSASAKAVLQGLSVRDRQLFELRLERYFQNLIDGLAPVYGQRADFKDVLERLILRLAEHYRDRPDELKALDIERDLTPDWFQRENMIGYVFYVERFAGDLPGVLDKLDYLEELGANYLHFLSALKPRSGENDGGYAVEDYRAIDPKLGDIDDLEQVCASLRQRGLSVCIDLVLNHCADTHAWAERAKAGERRYQEYFYTFEDRTMPDAYEATLPEVFPDFAPGNFSFVPEMNRWVWTSFNNYQWDLNWSNPDIFVEIIDIMFYLANKGVEVFRLDAVAFLWKRLGTDSQNQSEVHDILQALRACSKIVAPATAHKAEAIVSPDDLIHYFGTGRRYGKVSNIAYHNSLMVQFWSALASRDTRLMTHTLREFPRTPTSIAWGTYMRCHDDIGWAVTDEDAAAVGLNGFAHRAFLSDYYAGLFPGSHATGAVFQHNPATGDRRISGTMASLAGLEQALKDCDEPGIAMSIERILAGFALMLGFGGIPLIYMGDEIGLTNDYDYGSQAELADDNRWMHRPHMAWDKAERRHLTASVEQRIFGGVLKMIRARKRSPHLHANYANEILDSRHPHIFSYVRQHPLGNMLCLYNFSEHPQYLDTGLLDTWGLSQPFDQLEQNFIDRRQGSVYFGPYQRYWLI